VIIWRNRLEAQSGYAVYGRVIANGDASITSHNVETSDLPFRAERLPRREEKLGGLKYRERDHEYQNVPSQPSPGRSNVGVPPSPKPENQGNGCRH
jgi:hypothetical protein